MREQVGHHEPAVAVSDDADPVGIGDAHVDGLGHGRLGVGHQLRHERVVGCLRIADHRHGGLIEHGVATQQEEQVRWTVNPHEPLRRASNLAGGRDARVFEWIGVEHGRNPRALDVARRQHQLEAERHTVRPLVAHEALLDLAQLGRWILEAGDRLACQGPLGLSLCRLDRPAERGQIVIRNVCGRFGADHEMVLVAGERHEVLVMIRIAAEEALRFTRAQASEVEEGPVALVGGATAAEVDRITRLAHHPLAVGQRSVHRRARVPVPVVFVDVEPQSRGPLVHIEEPDVDPAAHPLALREHQHAAFLAPRVRPPDPVLGPEDLRGFGRERSIEAHQSVTVRDLGEGVPSVERFDPVELVGGGVAPGYGAGAQGHSLNRYRVGHR